MKSGRGGVIEVFGKGVAFSGIVEMHWEMFGMQEYGSDDLNGIWEALQDVTEDCGLI